MEPNYIFGLTKRHISLEEPIRAGWVISASAGGRDYHASMGTPCLVLKAPDKPHISDPNMREPRKAILLPFTAQYGLQNRLYLDNRHNVRSLAVKVGHETDFFDQIQTMNIGKLNINKIYQAAELVKGSNPITLVSDARDSASAIVDQLVRMYDHFHQSYKYAFQGNYTHNGIRSLIPGDKSVLAITLMDIGQCVPIFDPDKVDGILINVCAMYTEQSVYKDKLISPCEMTFYYSNHATNLLSVDGQTIERKRCSAEYMAKIVTSCEKHLKDIGKFRPPSEAKKTSSKEMKKRGEKLAYRSGSKPPSSYTGYGGGTATYYTTDMATTTNTF